MNPRQLRRAQERKARKLAHKIEQRDAASAESRESKRASQAQLLANRANAELSTGPQTTEGKAASRLNAVKTALTGRTVLLPSDNTEQYRQHVSRFFAELIPAAEREAELVQSLADTQWRLNRIPSLEMAVYALARIEFHDMFPQEDAAVRAALIEAHTFIAYHKQLNNLSIQEARLRRQYQKDLAELKELQAERLDRREKDPGLAAVPEIGFVFSSDLIETVENQPIPVPDTIDLLDAA